MITSRIDWGGFIGPKGGIYILAWNEEDEIPVNPATSQLKIEKPDGEIVAVRQGRIRVLRVKGRSIPTRICDEIARRQLAAGHISHLPKPRRKR